MNTPEYLRIGKVLGAHGLDGRLKIYLITDIPARFSPGNMVYVLKEGGYEAMTVAGFALQKGRIALVSFEGVDTRNDAEPLKGMEIFIDGSSARTERNVLDENSFYYYELLGVEVYLHGSKFGQVSDVLEAGCGNVLVIARLDGSSCMVPFVDAMVDTARIGQNRIDIHPVDGLFDAGDA